MTVLCPHKNVGTLVLSATERTLKHNVVTGWVRPTVRQLLKINCR